MFYLSASTNKLRRAIGDITRRCREETGGIRRSALARGSSQAASYLPDVQYAVIVVLRRRVCLGVVFDGSLVLGCKELMCGVRVLQHIGSWLSSFVVLLQRRRQSHAVCLGWRKILIYIFKFIACLSMAIFSFYNIDRITMKVIVY